MKTALLQVGIQPVFPQNIQDPSNRVDVGLSRVLSVDEDVIQIHDDEDVEFLGQNLIDIALETCWSVG